MRSERLVSRITRYVLTIPLCFSITGSTPPPHAYHTTPSPNRITKETRSSQMTEIYQPLHRRLQEFSAQHPHCHLSVSDPATTTLIFSNRAREALPPASTIKMIVAYSVIQQALDNKITLQDTIQLESGHLAPGSGIGLSPGKYTIYELLAPMLIYSDNSAANALISHFQEEIAQSIAQLGLEHTEISRLYYSDGPGRLSTSTADLDKFYTQIYRLLRNHADHPAVQTSHELVSKRQTKFIQGHTFAKYGAIDGVISGEAGILFLPEQAFTYAIMCTGNTPQSVFQQFSQTLQPPPPK